MLLIQPHFRQNKEQAEWDAVDGEWCLSTRLGKWSHKADLCLGRLNSTNAALIQVHVASLVRKAGYHHMVHGGEALLTCALQKIK
jgi:hypothetical protein